MPKPLSSSFLVELQLIANSAANAAARSNALIFVVVFILIPNKISGYLYIIYIIFLYEVQNIVSND